MSQRIIQLSNIIKQLTPTHMVSEKDGQFFIMLDMKPSLLSAEVVSTNLVISSLNATQKKYSHPL